MGPSETAYHLTGCNEKNLTKITYHLIDAKGGTQHCYYDISVKDIWLKSDR